jgi:hypothetical protein
MVGVQVSAVMVKSLSGVPERRQYSQGQRSTDDRGVYRFYGLRPGIYVVFTQGNMLSSPISPYEGYARTYHPSSPRETAAEIRVTDGGEATGVDIRYRGARGYNVSGVAAVGEAARQAPGMSVALYDLSSASLAGHVSFGRVEAQNEFTIKGLTNGEYEIIARVSRIKDGEPHVSPPRRVMIRGADVGGIELKLAPMASISGKVVFEASPNVCEGGRKSSLSGIFVNVRPDTNAMSDARRFGVDQSGGLVSGQGEFKISSLDPNLYFISLQLPDENWYAKSIAAPVMRARADPVEPVTTYDVGRNGLALKSGDRMTGLIVTIADGAASLRGRLAAENASLRPHTRVIVHLVPAEAAAVDDVLRYAEAVARSDGSFSLNNIAPGKYWLVARAAPDDVMGDSHPAQVAQEANERAKLRREAETLKTEVELKPCQRALDQLVKYPAK